MLDISLGRSVKATNEDDAISTGEVETVEALVRKFARRVTGAEPAESEWEPEQLPLPWDNGKTSYKVKLKEVTTRPVETLAVGLARAREEAVAHAEQLQQALLSRDVIGQAKGIIMERERVTADQAFE